MHTPESGALVRLPLSSEQKSQVKTATGLDGEAIELTVEELEQRITPRLSSNRNETMLTGW